jgi:serine/threonine protein kinase
MSIPDRDKYAPEELVVGQIVDGRYRILSVIGQGGMGTVYRVEQVMLKREFALKTLNGAHVSDVSWMRFQKEARAANILDHKNLVKVHDMGMIEGCVPYILMDYCAGITLAQRLKQDGPMPLCDVLPIFIKVCHALGYAHSKGVVHRDIKPSNIILGEERDADGVPELKIVDFGIAKLVNIAESESLALTKTGEIFGTPFYMSPEQCLGERTDARSDIYSLGCVMYEVLTGTPPLLGENALSTMMKHQSEVPLPLKEASLGVSFPDAVAIVIGKMIEKKPGSRYQRAEDVAEDLRRVSLGQPVAVAEPAAPDDTVRGARRDIPVYAIACAALLTCLLGVFFLGRITTQHVPAADQSQSTVATDDAAALAVKTVASIAPKPVIANNGPSPEIPKPLDNDHFSTWSKDKPSTVYFRFPPPESDPDQIIGTLLFDDKAKAFVIKDKQVIPVADNNHPIAALGNMVVENFAPMTLKPSMAACDDPAMLKKFRPTEIDNLNFHYQLATSDKTMAQVALLFPYLRKLSVRATGNMRKVALTDAAMQSINKFTDLVELDVGESHITSRALAGLKTLKALKVLKAEKMLNPSHYLKVLKGSSRLEHLEIPRSEQDDQEAGLVATLGELEYLDLSQSRLLTDRGVALLAARLGNLHSLYLHDCKGVTAASIPALKKLRRLRLLTISFENWSKAQQDKLLAALPDCKILSNYPEAERLESPNQ